MSEDQYESMPFSERFKRSKKRSSDQPVRTRRGDRQKQRRYERKMKMQEDA